MHRKKCKFVDSHYNFTTSFIISCLSWLVMKLCLFLPIPIGIDYLEIGHLHVQTIIPHSMLSLCIYSCNDSRFKKDWWDEGSISFIWNYCQQGGVWLCILLYFHIFEAWIIHSGTVLLLLMEKSCTTRDIPNSVNNGINNLSTGAGLIPSTVCPCSDCSSSMKSTILQVRPVCLSPPVADLKFLNVVVCSCLVSPTVSPAPWKNGAYPMVYSFLEKGWETWGNSLQSNIFKHSTFGSLANKHLTMALLVVSTLTNCGMIIHHYQILSISEYANVFQTKTLGDSGSLLSHLKKVSTLPLRIHCRGPTSKSTSRNSLEHNDMACLCMPFMPQGRRRH